MNNSTSFEANFSSSSCIATFTQVPGYLAIFVVTFVAICILAGGFGNTVVLILLWRRQNLRKVPHYLLGNLALTGVLSALFAMPSLIVMTTVNYFQLRDLPAVEILCKVEAPFNFAFIALNALTLSLMAFDRHECVLHPFNRRLTVMNVKKIIAVIWIVSFIITVVFFILIRNESSVCFVFYPYNNIHKLNRALQSLIAAVGQLNTITVICIIVTYFRIIKKLRRSSRVHSSNSLHQRNEKKLTKLTYKICGIFLLFRVPAMVCHLVTQIEKFQGNVVVNTATLVAVTLVNFIYVANPVLHHKMLRINLPSQAGGAVRQVGEPVPAHIRETDETNR